MFTMDHVHLSQRNPTVYHTDTLLSVVKCRHHRGLWLTLSPFSVNQTFDFMVGFIKITIKSISDWTKEILSPVLQYNVYNMLFVGIRNDFLILASAVIWISHCDEGCVSVQDSNFTETLTTQKKQNCTCHLSECDTVDPTSGLTDIQLVYTEAVRIKTCSQSVLSLSHYSPMKGNDLAPT